jgi:thymidine phosphorylase
MEQGEPVALVHARSHDDATAAVRVIESAYGFSERRPRTINPVLRRIGA